MSEEESPTRDSFAMHVELEGAPDSLPTSGTLNGCVVIDIAADVKLRGIFVSLVCSVHCEPGTESVSLASTRVDGDDPSGTTHRRHPFSIGIPEGPISHRGQLIQVDWRLHAHTMVPGALRLATSVPVQVVLGAAPRERRVVGSHDHPGLGFALALLGAALCTTLGVAISLPTILTAVADPVVGPAFGLVSALLVAAVGYALANVLRSAVGRALVGRVGLEIQGSPSPGEQLTISVHRPAQSVLFPRGGQATLAVSERVRVQRGRRMTTNVHSLHEEVQTLVPIVSGAGSILSCSFLLPKHELPDPFRFTSAACAWELRLRAPLFAGPMGRALEYHATIPLRIDMSPGRDTSPR